MRLGKFSCAMPKFLDARHIISAAQTQHYSGSYAHAEGKMKLYIGIYSDTKGYAQLLQFELNLRGHFPHCQVQ